MIIKKGILDFQYTFINNKKNDIIYFMKKQGVVNE